MTGRKASLRAVGLLLFLWLMWGAGKSPVWAGPDPGNQWLLVLDIGAPSGDGSGPAAIPQTAGLLAHLLKDHDLLGLMAPGDPEIILPISTLSSGHRNRILGAVADLQPSPRRRPLPEIVLQALEMFHSDRQGQRFLVVLTGGDSPRDSRETKDHLENIRKIADKAAKVGVVIDAVSLSPGISAEECQVLTSATGGRFRECKSVDEIFSGVLDVCQTLGCPQEAPLQDAMFRLDPWVRKAVVIAPRSIPGKGVSLTIPTGARLTRKTTSINIRWIAGRTHDLISISRPPPGIWTLTGARSGGSRVFLDTELTLSTAGTPREVGEDEVLCVMASLHGGEKKSEAAGLSSSTEFRADLRIPDDTRIAAKLIMPDTGVNPAPPPETRVGWFAPRHRQGEGILTVQALGGTFQRLVSLPIKVTKPWYQVVLPAVVTSGALPIRFQPEPERRPGKVAGVISVQSDQGAWAGKFLKPAPGSEIILDPSPGGQHPCLVNLHLTGTDSEGRPLIIDSGPHRLEPVCRTPDKPPQGEPLSAWEERTPVAKAQSFSQKLKRRWFPFTLIGLGVFVVLTAALLLWRERRGDGTLEDGNILGGSGDKNILRLQAQVEALTKEKVKLQEDLKEKGLLVDRLMAEKAEIQEDLDRLQAKSQSDSQSLEELKKKLEEAEKEAQGFQQEYMALYARSQKEKETMKKN